MQEHYMEIAKASYYLYIALLTVAALFDIWKFIIPNVISVALVALFIVVGLASPFEVDWLSHFGGAGIFFVVGIGLYAFKILGAGDVKLITAVAVWWGFEYLVDLLFFIGIAGGGLALVLLGLRRLLPALLISLNAHEKIKLPRVLLPGELVPYGVGVAVGSIFLTLHAPLIGGL